MSLKNISIVTTLLLYWAFNSTTASALPMTDPVNFKITGSNFGLFAGDSGPLPAPVDPFVLEFSLEFDFTSTSNVLNQSTGLNISSATSLGTEYDVFVFSFYYISAEFQQLIVGAQPNGAAAFAGAALTDDFVAAVNILRNPDLGFDASQIIYKAAGASPRYVSSSASVESDLSFDDANPVPAPTTLALLILGLTGLGWSSRKKI